MATGKCKIFTPSKNIPGTPVVPRGRKKAVYEGTLDNHLNEGEHVGTLDDRDRHGLDAHPLPTKVMGQS
jgi:hypothetical protein